MPGTSRNFEGERSQLLKPGKYIDSDSEEVQKFTATALEGLSDATDTERAVSLFNAVRDGIRYDPYEMDFDAERYRASFIATRQSAFCVPKAILLTACLRAAGIPAAIGLADVRNHLTSQKLADLMQTDLFVCHGYVQLWLGDNAYKVTPAFNIELCERFGVKPLAFDGTADALFHEFDTQNRRHMEYVDDRGIYADAPVEEMIETFRRVYPRIEEHVRQVESGRSEVDFDEKFAPSGAQATRDPSPKKPLCLEDFAVGDVLTFGAGPLTKDDIIAFAREWDPQPLHTVEAYATGLQGSLIASGFHTMVHVMKPVTTQMMARCENIGGFGFDALKWPHPLRPGQELAIRVEFTEVRPSQSRPDCGVIGYTVEARNAQNELVFSGQTAAMIRRHARDTA